MIYYYPFADTIKSSGTVTEAVINGINYKILPLAHPHQISVLGSYCNEWYDAHQEWEISIVY